MSLSSDSEFAQYTGDLFHETFLVCVLRSAKQLSLIVECLDANGNEAVFPPDTLYHIQVSNDAWDNPREGDFFSYYNLMIKEENWITLRSYKLTGTRVTNSWSERQTGMEATPLHFKYCRFLVEEVPDRRIRLTAAFR